VGGRTRSRSGQLSRDPSSGRRPARRQTDAGALLQLTRPSPLLLAASRAVNIALSRSKVAHLSLYTWLALEGAAAGCGGSPCTSCSSYSFSRAASARTRSSHGMVATLRLLAMHATTCCSATSRLGRRWARCCSAGRAHSRDLPVQVRPDRACSRRAAACSRSRAWTELTRDDEGRSSRLLWSGAAGRSDLRRLGELDRERRTAQRRTSPPRGERQRGVEREGKLNDVDSAAWRVVARV